MLLLSMVRKVRLRLRLKKALSRKIKSLLELALELRLMATLTISLCASDTTVEKKTLDVNWGDQTMA